MWVVAGGDLHERAGDRLDHLATVLDTDLTGEDDEELVLLPVDMKW